MDHQMQQLFGFGLKLQRFLRDFEGFANVPLSGFYDLTTYRAVMVFQTRYSEQILAPWGIDYPTGYVYITTTLAINNLYCERDPATTLDLQYIYGTTSTATTTLPLPFPTDESEMGSATSTNRFFLAALGVFNFFKLIPYWWWIILLLIIISYLLFELIRERRRNRPQIDSDRSNKINTETDLR